MTQKLFVKFDQTIKRFIEIIGEEKVQEKIDDVLIKAKSLEKGYPLTYQTQFYPKNLHWFTLNKCFNIWDGGGTVASNIEQTNDDALVALIAVVFPIVQLFDTLPESRKKRL